MRPTWRDLRRPAEIVAARLLLPTPCFGCGRMLGVEQLHGACLPCWSSILPAPAFPPTARTPPLEVVHAAAVYQGFARRVLLRAKMRGRRELLVPLAAQLTACVVARGALARGTVVVPVPSHPWTRLVRGFDPARDLAGAISRRLGAALLPGALRRRWTASPSLKRLGAAGRRRAAERAFFCPRPSGVCGLPVLLVDDVWTTGATARACAGALLAAGAASVGLQVWAVTPRPGGGGPRSPSV